MTIAVRSFNKTVIETKPGVDKKKYLEQFASAALSGAPHHPYSADIEFDHEAFEPTLTLVDLLTTESEQAQKIPLVAAAQEPEAKFEDLPPEVQPLFGGYPLVEGERVSSIRMLCLEKDWEGMARRTVFVERETNFARAYFAVPSLRADPKTPGLTPAALLRVASAPIVNAAAVGPVLASAGEGPTFEDIGVPIINTFLDIVGTLSWAIPEAGPFVSAGVTFIQFIMGEAIAGFRPRQPSLLDNIATIANNVVDRLEFFQEQAELKKQLQALKAFSDWLKNVATLLNTQDQEAFRLHMTEKGGILEQLNLQFGPDVEYSLFKLRAHSTMTPTRSRGRPTSSWRHWALASAKLRLIFLTTSEYLFALKLKIILLARLYAIGYDYDGRPSTRSKLKIRTRRSVC